MSKRFDALLRQMPHALRGWLDDAALHIREALGAPTVQDCDMCGGQAWEVRTTAEGRACIMCVHGELEDARLIRQDALGYALARADGLGRQLADALAAIGTHRQTRDAAIHRARKLTQERDAAIARAATAEREARVPRLRGEKNDQ